MSRDASDVAKRCLCIELLLQRLGLEIDEDDPVVERDAVRLAWLSRLGQLGIDQTFIADERSLLERPVGELTEAECDAIEGRVISGLALLWTIGRIPALPDADSLGEATAIVAEHGVLGDGSIPAAKATVAGAKLRPGAELATARTGAAKTKDDSFLGSHKYMVASLVVEALAWVSETAT